MASPVVVTTATAAVEKVGTVVIGAGVIGLAVARSLVRNMQRGGRGGGRDTSDVLVLERNEHIGAETSSRNSEVVHGGLYYPTNSLKAKFCVQGRQMIYDFCDSHGVQYNKVGKLVVAKDAQQMNTTVRALYEQSRRNGYHDVRILTPSDVEFMEPNVKCSSNSNNNNNNGGGGGALWSPETGIVDSHSLMLSLLADAEQSSDGSSSSTLLLALCTPVEKARIVDTNNQPQVQLYAGGMWLQPDVVVNSAGLWADHVARLIHNNNNHDENEQQQQQQHQQQQWKPPRQYYARGTYFQLNAKSPFSHLIYPVPDKRGGLGVHATLDANNRVRFGPDVEWLAHETNPDEIDYQPDESRGDSFYDAIRTYWPDLPDNSLTADYTGVRPKLCHPGVPGSGFGQFQDFYIAGPEEHGIPGLVHLFGMESPGLTSCMAIADHVASLLFRKPT